jgi:hypothetical protein
MKPVQQYGYFYAFVRKVPEPASIHDWDTDQRLQTTIALSRLIRADLNIFSSRCKDRVSRRRNFQMRVSSLAHGS